MAARSDVIQEKRVVFDIISDMLEALREQELWSQTRLAYRCKLDTRTSTKYVDFLLKAKLAIRANDEVKLQITQKGRKFLEDYQKLMKMLEEETLPTGEPPMIGK